MSLGVGRNCPMLRQVGECVLADCSRVIVGLYRLTYNTVGEVNFG